MDVEVAERRITRADDVVPLTALVVVQHGRARSRAAWPGEEGTRPLTATGKRQADALVPVLSAFGVAEVITSPWTRCRATVAPYTGAADLAPAECEPLTEAQHADSPEKAADAVAPALRSPADVALCTHRPVLPTVLSVLAQHARRQVRPDLPTEDPYLRPGHVLVSNGPDGPRIEAVEVHAPVV